jgi:GxxExxY protein
MQKNELTHKIIGCAMAVHTTLGPGFFEIVYQKALAIELQKQGIEFERELTIALFYDNVQVGHGRVDFYVENAIMLELKALVKLEDAHLAQTMNYCRMFKLPFGLLINFGAPSLEFKRIYNLYHPENRKL